MRTLHIIATLDPAAGGTTEFVLTLMANTPPGDRVEVLTLDDPGATFLSAVRAPVHALGPVRSIFSYSSKLLPWLRNNRKRFDLLIVHGLWQYTGISTALVATQAAPYLVFPHGNLDPHFKRAYPGKHLKKWVYWLLAEYWILRRARAVVFTTAEEARLARQSFWLHRWTPLVIPFGTVPPAGDAQAQRKVFLSNHRHLQGKRYVLFLGRIHRKKGCDLLLEAFCRVAASDPDLHLVLAGPDQQGWVSDLKALAASAHLTARVHFPGMLTGDAKWGAIHACEAFILPSHQENFGIAVAEALACGKPVLLSDKVNIAPEIAADNAGLVESDTFAGTETLLRRWISTPPTARAAMSVAALTCFETRYDLRRNLPDILRLLHP